MKRSLALWSIALLVTLGSATWQRLTGPTYPARVEAAIDGQRIEGRLLRSQTIDAAVPVSLQAADGLTGEVRWRRWPGEHPWQSVALQRAEDRLVGELPAQTVKAARIEYVVKISDGQGRSVDLSSRLRFKGPVPGPVLFVHVAAMVLGMLFSLRAGLEALTRGRRLRALALVTLICLGGGGLLLGPVVQKYAFGAFWTGWPLGEDLTDNKLAAAVLVWLLAFWQVRRGRRGWAVAASAVTLVVFLIPHSLHGSTHDWQTGRHIQAGLPLSLLALRPLRERTARSAAPHCQPTVRPAFSRRSQTSSGS